MSAFMGELIGTALLIIMGNGVVANVVLNKTKGNNGGLIVITFGWAMAVFMGVYISTKLGGGGHLNPAVTIAMAASNSFDSALILPYISGQLAGAFLGAVLVWATYKLHFDATEDKELKLAVFCTGPAIPHTGFNLLSETIGTAVLVFAALSFSPAASSLGTLDALPVSLVVLGIGLSLGGPTGYAINPARDLAPRIAHFILPIKNKFILPIKNKRDSNWGYSWVPVLGPIIGAVAAAWLYSMVAS